VVLALLVVIVASHSDVVPEDRVLVAIDHGSHICKDRLDLRLLNLIQPWRTQIFQSCRVVPVDFGRHSCCAEITTHVSVAHVTREEPDAIALIHLADGHDRQHISWLSHDVGNDKQDLLGHNPGIIVRLINLGLSSVAKFFLASIIAPKVRAGRIGCIGAA
jgi:hypothetical protein